MSERTAWRMAVGGLVVLVAAIFLAVLLLARWR